MNIFDYNLIVISYCIVIIKVGIILVSKDKIYCCSSNLHREMLDTLNNVHPFEHVLYILYMDYLLSDEDVLKFATENNIDGIVMSESRFNKVFVSNLKNAGIHSYVHTINDLEKAKSYINSGVYGIYTDYLLSGELEIDKK